MPNPRCGSVSAQWPCSLPHMKKAIRYCCYLSFVRRNKYPCFCAGIFVARSSAGPDIPSKAGPGICLCQDRILSSWRRLSSPPSCCGNISTYLVTVLMPRFREYFGDTTKCNMTACRRWLLRSTTGPNFRSSVTMWAKHASTTAYPRGSTVFTCTLYTSVHLQRDASGMRATSTTCCHICKYPQPLISQSQVSAMTVACLPLPLKPFNSCSSFALAVPSSWCRGVLRTGPWLRQPSHDGCVAIFGCHSQGPLPHRAEPLLSVSAGFQQETYNLLPAFAHS